MVESSRIDHIPVLDINLDGNILKTVLKPGSGPVTRRDDVTVNLLITQGTSEIFTDDALMLSLETSFVPQGLIDLLCTMQIGEEAQVSVKSQYFKANFSEYVPEILSDEDLTVNLTVKETRPVQDLYGDGSFYMRFMERTTETDSTGCTRARIHYKLEINGYYYLDNTQQIPLQLHIEDTRVPEVWLFAIRKMKQGENVRIECDLNHEKSVYLDNGTDSNYNISSHKPNGSTVAYLYLKVHSFDTGLLTDGVTPTERSELAMKLKDEGNGFFKAGDFPQAKNMYLSALATLEPVSDDPTVLRPNSSVLLGNLSLVYIKMEEWSTAEKFSTMAIDINPRDVKALYRRALAKNANHMMSSALDDLKIAKEAAIEKQDNEMVNLISKEIAAINSEFKKISEAEKARYKNLFK